VIFFSCAGPAEICAPLRTALAEAVAKAGLTSVRRPERADLEVDADVSVLQEKVSRQFGTTFSVRTFSIELSAEKMKTSEIVPMPAVDTFSFDAQFGSQRARDRARLVAQQIVDGVKAFAADGASPR
jgi:hypothetical protein